MSGSSVHSGSPASIQATIRARSASAGLGFDCVALSIGNCFGGGEEHPDCAAEATPQRMVPLSRITSSMVE